MAKALLIILVLCTAGCTKLKLLPYLDQALMLQDFGRDKEAQHKFIANVNAQYDKLEAALNSKTIEGYKNETEVVKAFGPALLNLSVNVDGKDLRQALYRYAIWRQAKTKIYLYYDPQGQLVKWEQLPSSF